MELPTPKTLVTVGEIVVEIMATEIGQVFLEPGPLVGPFPSGAPAIFIDQAARLGQPCGMIAAVGDDDFGTLNIERLRSSGVDVSAIERLPGVPTGTAFVRYAADGSRAFVFNIPLSASGHIRLTEAGQALLSRADHVHVMGSSLFSPAVVAVVREAIGQVKARGGTVSFDPNIRPEMLERPGMREALQEILQACDLFLPSGSELFLFTKARHDAEAVAELLARGIRAIVVKRGAEGATYHDRDTTEAVDAFRVREVDPTGAGDCFGAGFVCAWLRGASPREALLQANACGALAVGAKGPMAGTGTTRDVHNLIAAHKEVRL
ncbi:tagatose kinase [Aureimonas jatrophae]|uniref:Sugar or nucleoside kinase, ribokinase family n=1 Tax=Aureimonas jatrophae TaxID=1166073 RepID=A0A1H0C5U3_9HYPH|nr:sugar kinase [Aureimonas jatrophae]MBB3949080.1 sugar/nucleoside kinase (ribokinase family) [Aureimonas jatrophae]SDN53228.1 Sugar or nucleoside kinase, ribokinase family [Aureimonas jatrophae]